VTDEILATPEINQTLQTLSVKLKTSKKNWLHHTYTVMMNTVAEQQREQKPLE
jgi:hypothetical protein